MVIMLMKFSHLKMVEHNNSSFGDYLVFCNHSASVDDFNFLTRENKRFFQEHYSANNET